MPTKPNAADTSDASTPLDEDEAEGLIPPHLQTRAELNQWEAQNILQAVAWSTRRKRDMLSVRILEELHRRMFSETWQWAGRYRSSDKSISPFQWGEVPRLVQDLVLNTTEQHKRAVPSTLALDMLAARFHHELVRIHPWPNGNGRHSRLATDLLLRQWQRPPFTWGNATPVVDALQVRSRYLRALRDADAGAFDALMLFVRS